MGGEMVCGFLVMIIYWIFFKGLKMFDFEIVFFISKIYFIIFLYFLIIFVVSIDVVCKCEMCL